MEEHFHGASGEELYMTIRGYLEFLFFPNLFVYLSQSGGRFTCGIFSQIHTAAFPFRIWLLLCLVLPILRLPFAICIFSICISIHLPGISHGRHESEE